MTHPHRRTLIAALVALALPAAALAQQQSQQQPKQQSAQKQQRQQQNLSQVHASRLKDMKVVDSQGKEIGQISEVVVDLQSGRVHAAVVEFGGFMGMGEKQFAFSPKELKPGKGGNQVVLNIDKQKLENREGFAKNQWPAMGDEYWGKVGGQASAGASAQQKQGGQMALMRVSELVGTQVQDKQGKDVGEVRDVILDLQKAQLRNVVLDVEGGGRATVAPKSLSKGTGDKLVTSMSRDQLTRQSRRGRDSAASAGGNRPRGDGDVGNFGPERAGQDPFGAAKSGTVQGGTTTQGERIGAPERSR